MDVVTDKDVVLGVIDRALNPSARIQITIRDWVDKRVLDIREYQLDEYDQWKPSRKGFCLSIDTGLKLVEKLYKMRKKIKKGR